MEKLYKESYFQFIASGLLLFFYLSILFLASSYISGLNFEFQRNVKFLDFGLVFIAMLSFEISYIFYSKKLIVSKADKFKKYRNLGYFSVASLVFIFSCVLIVFVSKYESLNSLVFSLVFCGSMLPCVLALIMLIKSFNAFFLPASLVNNYKFQQRMLGGLPSDVIFSEGEFLINYCRRLGYSLGLIVVKCLNMQALIETYGNECRYELHKQINFLLTNISRKYEQWGYYDLAYFSFLFCSSREEFENTMKRYENALNKNKFIWADKNIDVQFVVQAKLYTGEDLKFDQYENCEKDFLNAAVEELVVKM